MPRPVFASLIAGLALALIPVACDEPLSLPLKTTESPILEPGNAFDPQIAGTINGKVTWDGPIPVVPAFRAPLSTGTEGEQRDLHTWPNPHAPLVDPVGRGVA